MIPICQGARVSTTVSLESKPAEQTGKIDADGLKREDSRRLDSVSDPFLVAGSRLD